MSFIKSCYGNIGKWRSTMFTWPPSGIIYLFAVIYYAAADSQDCRRNCCSFELENAVSNYPPLFAECIPTLTLPLVTVSQN